MESLQKLMATFLESHEQWKFQLMINWTTIVGDMQHHICLEKIEEKGTLIVGVHDTRWMQELYYLSHELIDLINRGLQGSFVKSIRFVLSRRLAIVKKTARKVTPARSIPKKSMMPRRSLTDRHVKALERIHDNELQASLRNLMQLSS